MLLQKLQAKVRSRVEYNCREDDRARDDTCAWISEARACTSAASTSMSSACKGELQLSANAIAGITNMLALENIMMCHESRLTFRRTHTSRQAFVSLTPVPQQWRALAAPPLLARLQYSAGVATNPWPFAHRSSRQSRRAHPDNPAASQLHRMRCRRSFQYCTTNTVTNPSSSAEPNVHAPARPKS